jgi:hypothetical protein
MIAADGSGAPGETDHDDELAKKLARLPEIQREQYDAHVQNTIDHHGAVSREYRHGLADTYLQRLPPHAENVQIQDHNWRESYRAHEREQRAARERLAPSEQPQQQSPEPPRTLDAPPKPDDTMERARANPPPRDYSQLQSAHDQAPPAPKQTNTYAELRARTDLLQREAERTSTDPQVLRGSRQLIEIDQRRLDRRIKAADPATAAELRAEKEARVHEYVGYLTDTIGVHLGRDGRYAEAVNMHREAAARWDIAAQLRGGRPAPFTDGIIDDSGQPQHSGFAHESVPGVDGTVHTPSDRTPDSPATVARRPGHYAELEAAHAEVAAMQDASADAAAERALAQTNSEIASRQQAEVAISTGGATPPDAALTRHQMLDGLKAMARDSAERDAGPERDDSNPQQDAPARPPPGREGIGP